MPRLAVLSVLSAASSPCPDLNLIHYNMSAIADRLYIDHLGCTAAVDLSCLWFAALGGKRISAVDNFLSNGLSVNVWKNKSKVIF